jgi:hypothetical protein
MDRSLAAMRGSLRFREPERPCGAARRWLPGCDPTLVIGVIPSVPQPFRRSGSPAANLGALESSRRFRRPCRAERPQTSRNGDGQRGHQAERPVASRPVPSQSGFGRFGFGQANRFLSGAAGTGRGLGQAKRTTLARPLTRPFDRRRPPMDRPISLPGLGRQAWTGQPARSFDRPLSLDRPTTHH